MATSSSLLLHQTSPTIHSPWLNGRRWDLGWLIGSAAIVPVILALVAAGTSSLVLNIGVTALIGGPHLFSTYLATYMDPRFRKSHWPVLLAAAIGVPAFVVYWTLTDFQILLSVFIFAASAHVLQQNAFIADTYARRSGHSETPAQRAIDYGLLATCMYPIAAYKLVHGTFALSDVQILIPGFLRTSLTYHSLWIVFGSLLIAWCAKTIMQIRSGTVNVPKTMLIAATTVIAFFIPMAASGPRLELAFQAVNTWHSVQYFALVWLIQKLRGERGLIDSPLIAKLTGSAGSAWKMYATCFGTTAALFAALIVVFKTDPLHIPYIQYYYMGVLSCLLIHYVLDAYLFATSAGRHATPELLPYAVLAGAPARVGPG